MKTEQPTKEARQKFNTILAIVEEFRKVDPVMGSQTMAAFLYIAKNPGCSTADVGVHLGLSQASASRNVSALLKDRVSHGEMVEGYALAEQAIDPFNRRRRIINLTPRGRRVAESLLHHIK